MKEALQKLQKQLEYSKEQKERFEKRAARIAKGSSLHRELAEAAHYTEGVIKGLEFAIKAIIESEV